MKTARFRVVLEFEDIPYTEETYSLLGDYFAEDYPRETFARETWAGLIFRATMNCFHSSANDPEGLKEALSEAAKIREILEDAKITEI